MSTPFNKILATTKQLIRRNSIRCLKNQAISFQSEHKDPLPLFVFICCYGSSYPLPLHNKTFIKKGLLEEIEEVDDNASAFMHQNIKTNHDKKLLFKPSRIIYFIKLNFSASW